MRRLVLIGGLLLVVLSSYWLRQHPIQKTRVDLESQAASLPVLLAIDIFDVHELVTGWLWLRFDLDSMGAVQNYHRLLPWLDLMTAIQPQEFRAWGLKTYMRLLRPENANPKRRQEIIEKLSEAALRYPENYRGHFEVAWMYAFYSKEPALAMPWARAAHRLNSNRETASLVQYLQNRLNESGQDALPDFTGDEPTVELEGVLDPSDIRPVE